MWITVELQTVSTGRLRSRPIRRAPGTGEPNPDVKTIKTDQGCYLLQPGSPAETKIRAWPRSGYEGPVEIRTVECDLKQIGWRDGIVDDLTFNGNETPDMTGEHDD